MKPGEVVSFKHDRAQRGLPREGNMRKALETEAERQGHKPAAPALWSAKPAKDFPIPHTWGGYPQGFIEWAARAMHCKRQDIVHLCSGAIPAGEGALRVDIREEMNPDLVADCRDLPLDDNSAAAVMIDPPYSVEYSEDLYGTGYPRPSHLLKEAARIAMADAPIGMLHFLVPRPGPRTVIERVYGVTTGPNYRIRAFTIYRKQQADLFPDHDGPASDQTRRESDA